VGYPSLDEIIEAFEVVWNRDGEAQLERFLPHTDHPDFGTIAVELLCVDLERRAQTGRRKSIETYRRQFPGPLQNPRALERLAFEEYRWLKQHGEEVSPGEYARRYQIATDHWPEAISPDTRADRLGCGRSFPGVGDRFLDFKIVQQLGESRLGRVYLATQADLASRFVVLKVATDLWSESERLARLQHTNVVPIYSVHHRDGLQAVCMPYLGRQTLADVLRKFEGRAEFTASDLRELLFHGRDEDESSGQASRALLRQLDDLTFEQLCAWITSQIASGLAHAHERGILHRDLKPANILLTDYGQPMILDFNLSEDIIAGGRDSLLVGGTMPYMAPEHLKAVFSIGHIDTRSDIYSLGVILFQMLTGRLPFPSQDGSILATLSLVISARASTTPSVRAINPKISPALDAITRRCLAPDPNQRYQTARDLQQDLELHIQDFPLRHAPNPSHRERVHKWLRRHPRCTSTGVMATVLAVVLVIAASLIWLRGHRIDGLEAIEDFRQFETLARAAKAPLSVPFSPDETTAAGWQAAETALSLYGVDAPNWQEAKPYRLLDDGRQLQLSQSAQELLFLMAETSYRRAQKTDDDDERLAQLQLALRYNDAAQRSNDIPLRALLIQEADIRGQLGHEDEAARLVGDANQLPFGAELDRYAMAVHLLGNRRYGEASGLLGDLAHESPGNFYVWYLLGTCCYRGGEFDDADSCFTRCEALWPDNHMPYFQRGLSRYEDGRYERAEIDFTKSLERFPQQTNTLLNRALTYIKLGEFQKAVDDLTTAVERGSGCDESLVYLMRSQAWQKLGEEEQARLDLQAGLHREPVSLEGWIQRAAVRRPEDPQGALADLNQALRLNPQSRQALRNKAHVLGDHLDRSAEAIEALDSILTLYPHDVTALMGRAVLNARLDRPDAARHDARAALSRDASAFVYYQAACVFAQLSQGTGDDAAEAVKLLGEATKRDIRWAAAATKEPELLPIAQRLDFRRVIAAAAILQGTESTLADDRR
jgi:serine/threonine protein kinase/tetratricopeptide (TPR) repeat protein